MTTWLQDVRFGLRMMVRAPVLSAVAIVSLALAIAANAGIFAILNAFLFEPLPYADQDGLVMVQEVPRGRSTDFAAGLSVPNFRDYEAADRLLSDATLYDVDRMNLTGMDVPEQLQVVRATPSLLEVLGVQPALGRGFRPEEGAEGTGNVLVLTYDFWQRRFLGNRAALGRTVMLDGRPFTIIGVMPPDFDMLPANVQALRPSDFADRTGQRAARGLLCLGRLRPGVTSEQVQEELAAVAARLAAEYPEADGRWGVRVQRLREFFPGPTDRKLVMVLTAVTLFGLLIACANVANLLLAKAEVRAKEMVVRAALGAGKSRIVRQLVTESVVLGVAAGAVGVMLSVWLIRWLRTAMPAELPRAFMPALDPKVLLATLAVSVGAGILFGLAPALHAARSDLRAALGDGSRGGTAGRRRRRLRNAFVVAEFAVALAMLTGAGFMVQAFGRLIHDDPGFEVRGLLTFRISVPENRYPGNDAVRRYERELERALARVPGVRGVAIMSALPRGRDDPRARYTVEGRDVPETAERPSASFESVNPGYFSTLGIALRRGRLFLDSDDENAADVAVVSQALADREFADEDPVGRRVEVRGRTRTIIGVASNIVQARIEIAGQGGQAIYVPLAQAPLRSPSFALRTEGAPAALASAVRSAVWTVDPDQPVAAIRPLEAHIRESLAGPIAISRFLMAMAAMALLLAAMGIYGVMAQAVARRRREIAIRMALGAEGRQVAWMVTGAGASLAAIGMILGLPLAYLMYRGVASTLGLFGRADVVGGSFALWIAAILALTALLSTYLPARRASRIAPVTAMKEE